MADSIRAYFASQYHTALASWALATKDHAPSGRMKWVQGPLDAVEFCVSESWTRFLPEWLHSQSYGQRNQRTYQAFFGAIEAYGYSRGDLAEMARDPASRRLINDLDCRAKNCYSLRVRDVLSVLDLIRNSPEEAARCQLIAEEGRQRLADWEESRAESEAERSRLRSQLSENVCVDPRYKSKPGHLGGEETHDLYTE